MVIPTRGRPSELSILLSALQGQTRVLKSVVVIDSSEDSTTKEVVLSQFPEVEYVYSAIASAAVQRNLGLDFISRNPPDFVVFLDDDVVPSDTYISDLLSNFSDASILGVSGVAVEVMPKRTSLNESKHVEQFKRLFLLASRKQGKLLRSGVPIPVSSRSVEKLETEWLIGCSAWRYETIKEVRFEVDFKGYSLGEDVIFSYRVSKLGRLIVDPQVKLPHSESQTNRPEQFLYWRKWMNYRWRLCKLGPANEIRIVAFFWSSMGQFIINTGKVLSLRKGAMGGIFGIMFGLADISGLTREN